LLAEAAGWKWVQVMAVADGWARTLKAGWDGLTHIGPEGKGHLARIPIWAGHANSKPAFQMCT